jgi:hypothetical protein
MFSSLEGLGCARGTRRRTHRLGDQLRRVKPIGLVKQGSLQWGIMIPQPVAPRPVTASSGERSVKSADHQKDQQRIDVPRHEQPPFFL